MTDSVPAPHQDGRPRSVKWPPQAVLLALLLGVHAVLLIGSLDGRLSLVVLAGAASIFLDEAVERAPDGRSRLGLWLIEAGPGWRYFLRQALVVVFLLRSGELSRAAQVVVVLAVVARHVALGLFLATRLVIRRRRLRRVETRNLGVDGGVLPAAVPPPWLMREGPHVVLNADALVIAALAWAFIGGSYAAVAPAAVVAVVVGLVTTLPLVPHAWTLLRMPGGDALIEAAQAAVDDVAPVVILHFSGGVNAVYQVNMWLETMERLERRVLVLLRERRYLDQLAETTVPVLCLPYSLDLMTFEMPSARVSLFVANVGKNIHLLRVPTLMSAFIGHGDSDKTASFNPYTKVYDEVWVAGEAGRQRYIRAQVGIREDQIVLVGRPQLDAIQPAQPRPPGAPFTVLYAPTWEGWTEEPHQSSLIPSGIAIIRSLLAGPGVRVIYKPHPLTGTVNPAARQVSDAIADLLAQSGPEHVAVQGERTLYECFDESDALISDISSVVSDYLHSEKPYFVTNGAGIPDDEFRSQNPSAGAAYLVGLGAAGLAEGLADARGDDSLRARRTEVRTYLLGDRETDAMTLFRRAVDDLVAKSRARDGIERFGIEAGDDDERLEQQDEAFAEMPAIQ